MPIAANLRSGFASLAPQPAFTDVTYAGRVKGMGDLVARAVGARWTDNARACRGGPWTCENFVDRATHGLDDRWVLGRFGPVQSLAVIAVLVVGALVVLRAGSRLGRTCAVGLLVSPFMMALLSQSAYTRDARYASMVIPLAAVVLAQAAQQLVAHRRGRAITGAAIVAWITLALVVPAAVRLPHHRVDPDADLAPVVTVLRANGISALRAEYWIAYRLAYAAHEEFDVSPTSTVKFARYEAAVRSAEARGAAAMVLQRYQPVPPGHPPRLVEVGPYLVYLPPARF